MGINLIMSLIKRYNIKKMRQFESYFQVGLIFSDQQVKIFFRLPVFDNSMINNDIRFNKRTSLLRLNDKNYK